MAWNKVQCNLIVCIKTFEYSWSLSVLRALALSFRSRFYNQAHEANSTAGTKVSFRMCLCHHASWSKVELLVMRNVGE